MNLRNGPSTGYYSKGQLGKGTNFYVYCSHVSGTYTPWYYGKVTSGVHSGTKGWVFGDYLV
ncbi:SH3 domain-containing protein [Streptomyces nanshensis]|uniref:SH3 domain-containing protein n=1 Tax=Streptomyces nanshensis TaxID=518642 RepID=UPI000D1C017D|nr:SH3 domain-containing protein [Streptomyces nanshensis]